MQSSLSQELPSKEPLPTTTTAAATSSREESSPNIEILNKKRKRNRKKSTKVENLMSKTFQARLEAANLSKKINSDIIGQSNPISSMSSTSSSSIEKNRGEQVSKKLTAAVKKSLTPDKIIASTDSGIEQNVHQANSKSTTKTRENILAEREAKKLSKQMSKSKSKPEEGVTAVPVAVITAIAIPAVLNPVKAKTDKTREDIIAEREAKKAAKQSIKKNKTNDDSASNNSITNIENLKGLKKDETENIAAKLKDIHISGDQNTTGKKILSKAERRAIQEAQRAAKAKVIVEKLIVVAPKKPLTTAATASTKKTIVTILTTTDTEHKIADKSLPKQLLTECKVRLFNHLDANFEDKNLFVNNIQIHPVMIKLGEQFATRTVVGSNARCIAFLSALKIVIQDYETPPKKEFSRSLEASIKNSVDHLQLCRPLAVSVNNAHKCIKFVLTQLPTDQPESELKEHLCEFIETYIKDQIEKAALAISSSVQEKITDGDVILTFGCSSLINHILEEAHSRNIDFRVIVVDSRPFSEGQELLRRLVTKEICCTYVLINAVGFIMPEATKVLLGAHALLANGYVMARTGTAQVALVARSFNVPVLVCCETHKFSERVQTDAIVYNELGNPDDLVLNENCKLSNWQNSNSKIAPLNLNYDITPPELVTAVVTEVAILPCTSVPVILRLKPTEIGY